MRVGAAALALVDQSAQRRMSMREIASVAMGVAIVACAGCMGATQAGPLPVASSPSAPSSTPPAQPYEDGSDDEMYDGGDDEGYGEGIDEESPDAYAFTDEQSGPGASQVVTVSVTDALVGIKSNQRPWDGVGTIGDDTRTAMDTVLSAAGAGIYGAVATEVASLANTGFDPPDVAGTVVVSTSTGSVSVSLAKVPDSYSPQWGDATITNVPLAPQTRIRIVLVDKDLANDDPIGIYELNETELRAALADGHVFHVRVDTPANRQLLFIGLSVRPQ